MALTPEYMASHINIIQVLSSYYFNPEITQRPFHNLYSGFSISLNFTKTHLFPLKSHAQLPQPRGRPDQFARRKPLTRRANQRASSGYVTICCHHIDPRVAITTRLLHDIYTSKTISDAKL